MFPSPFSILRSSLPPSLQDATIATWSPSLQLQRGMSARTDFQASRRVPRGKRSSVWITDCALMSDSYRLVLATTSRELLFYDLSTATYKLQYRLYGMCISCIVILSLCGSS